MRGLRLSLTAVSLVAALFVATPSARANGRFPGASQLVVDPSNDQRIVVRATFGVLQTTDRGATWRWVCGSTS